MSVSFSDALRKAIQKDAEKKIDLSKELKKYLFGPQLTPDVFRGSSDGEETAEEPRAKRARTIEDDPDPDPNTNPEHVPLPKDDEDSHAASQPERGSGNKVEVIDGDLAAAHSQTSAPNPNTNPDAPKKRRRPVAATTPGAAGEEANTAAPAASVAS